MVRNLANHCAGLSHSALIWHNPFVVISGFLTPTVALLEQGCFCKMSASDRPLSSHLDFSDMNADEFAALLVAAGVNPDRSLYGIPPGENSSPYPYLPFHPEDSSAFPSCSHQSHSASFDNQGSFNDVSLFVHNSLPHHSASTPSASHASRSTIPQITFSEPQTSTPNRTMSSRLTLFIPDPALAGQEAPASAGFLETQSRSSGHDLLSPVSSPSVGYTSSESMDWDMLEDMTLDGQNDEVQPFSDREENQDSAAFQASQRQEWLGPLAQHPPSSETPHKQAFSTTMEARSYLVPVSPSTSRRDVQDRASSIQQTGSRLRSDSGSQGGKNKRKRMTPEERKQVRGMRELGACIRCQVLRIKVSR